jgi:hypothetical protein
MQPVVHGIEQQLGLLLPHGAARRTFGSLPRISPSITYSSPILRKASVVIGEACSTCRSWNLRRACAILLPVALAPSAVTAAQPTLGDDTVVSGDGVIELVVGATKLRLEGRVDTAVLSLVLEHLLS